MQPRFECSREVLEAGFDTSFFMTQSVSTIWIHLSIVLVDFSDFSLIQMLLSPGCLQP